jgi:hypothetical protein
MSDYLPIKWMGAIAFMLLTWPDKTHNSNENSLTHGWSLNDFFPNIKQEY